MKIETVIKHAQEDTESTIFYRLCWKRKILYIDKGIFMLTRYDHFLDVEYTLTPEDVLAKDWTWER